jgi:hypothetical protein
MSLPYQRGNICGRFSRISYDMDTIPVIIRLLEERNRSSLNARMLDCGGVHSVSSFCSLPFLSTNLGMADF